MSTVDASNVLATVSEKFNFGVDKRKLVGPNGESTDFYGLFRDDNNECVGDVVTDRYMPHTTDDVLALTEAAAHAFEGMVDAQCYFNNGHFVVLQPTVAERKSIYGTADNVFPRVIIRAGFDGTAAHTMLGWFRDACKNMARLRTVSSATQSIRHLKSLRPKMDELIKTFGVLKESWGDVTRVIEHMQNTQVKLSDFLIKVYGEPEDAKRSKTIHANRTEEICRRVLNERLITGRSNVDSEFNVSVWEAYNAVQGYVQHESTRHGSPTDVARAMLALNDKYVNAAEAVAMKLLVS